MPAKPASISSPLFTLVSRHWNTAAVHRICEGAHFLLPFPVMLSTLNLSTHKTTTPKSGANWEREPKKKNKKNGFPASSNFRGQRERGLALVGEARFGYMSPVENNDPRAD